MIEEKQFHDLVEYLAAQFAATSNSLDLLRGRINNLAAEVKELADVQQQLCQAITGLGPILGPNDQIRVKIPSPAEEQEWPSVIDDNGVEIEIRSRQELERVIGSNPGLALFFEECPPAKEAIRLQ